MAEQLSVFTAPGPGNLTAEERKRLEIETSKYLGGDERNTHRVKGLDFALLQKVRGESAMWLRGKGPAAET